MLHEDDPSRQGSLAGMEPSARVKQLSSYGAQVEVDPNVPPRRYYRSGQEIVRMANVYYSEKSYENAYILYIKFMTLFVEKIRKHPEYASVSAKVRANNQAQLKEVMVKAEKLKQKLLQSYAKEHENYLLEQKQQKAEFAKRKQQVDDDAKLAELLQADEDRQGHRPGPHLIQSDQWAVTPSAPGVADVLYPDDFLQPPRAPAAPPLGPPLVPPKPSDAAERWDPRARRLRTVRLPAALQPRFLALAAANTARNVETCGILAGVLERDQLKVSHVVVPQQTGSADSCSTTSEEELFRYQDDHDLITIGWIHTHPTQTAFLSSVDLHTQCSYQLMMPEAIAVVCAPKYNETGYFALTPEHGMAYITACRAAGFHPHPADPPLFYDVKHITIDSSAPIEVVDLRS